MLGARQTVWHLPGASWSAGTPRAATKSASACCTAAIAGAVASPSGLPRGRTKRPGAWSWCGPPAAAHHPQSCRRGEHMGASRHRGGSLALRWRYAGVTLA
jgi:hypothetical protein